MESSSFANLEYEIRKRRTRREKFLGRIEVLIRWEKIRPYDHSAGEQNSSKSAKNLEKANGRQTIPVGAGIKTLGVVLPTFVCRECSISS